MMIDTIVYCLKGATAMDCLNCPYFANRDGGIVYCRGKRLFEAIEIIKKYQEIQHIVKYDQGKGYQPSETITRIKEILEDEK